MERSDEDPHTYSPTSRADWFKNLSDGEVARIVDRDFAKLRRDVTLTERDQLEVAFLVGALYQRLYRSEAAKSHGLQPVELLLLLTCEFTDYLTQKQIAELLQLTDGAVSSGFRELRKRTLVEHDEIDAVTPVRKLPTRPNQKVRYHRLTEAGQEVVQSVGDRLFDAYYEIFPAMTGEEPL